jgi:hypothetical protein
MELQKILAKIDPSKQKEVMAAFRDCKSEDDAKKVVKKFNLPITDEEIDYFGKRVSEGKGDEINDELLSMVAGGAGAAGTVSPTLTCKPCW